MSYTPTAPENIGKMLVIKARFRAEKTKLHGSLILAFDETEQKLVRVNSIAGKSERLSHIDLNASWDRFDEEIGRLKWEGEQDSSVTNDIKGYLETHASADITHEFYNIMSNRNATDIKEELVRVLYKPLGTMDIDFDVRVQDLSAEEFEEGATRRKEREEKEQDKRVGHDLPADVSLTADSVVLDGTMLQAPIYGTPLNMLQVGQKILVHLSPQDTRAQAVYNQLNIQYLADIEIEKNAPIGKGPIVPVEVYQIGTTSNGDIYVVAHLIRNIYVRLFARDKINLRVYNPEVDKIKLGIESAEKVQMIKSSKPNYNLMWFISAIGITALAGLIYLLINAISG